MLQKHIQYDLDLIVNNELKTQIFDLYPSIFKNYFIKDKMVISDLGSVDNEIIDENIIIKKGEYHIQKPIILSKKNLIISPGTKLLFDKNTFIKIEDGDLIINGNENDKVRLEAYELMEWYLCKKFK